MNQHLWQGMRILMVGLALAATTTLANNIRVTNVVLRYTDTNAGTTDVRFDLSWDNSWRASWVETDTGHGDVTVTNWDAAWVFVKWRNVGTNWYHALLASNGHTAPAGTTIDVGANDAVTNVGAFIYRSTNGSGNLNLSKVRLRWNYAANGVSLTNKIDISVHAIEMVNIPQGDFYLGDGATNTGDLAVQFESRTNGTPFLITNEAYSITLGGGGADSLGNHNNVGGYSSAYTDDFNYVISQTLPAEFPKGYRAFYCMKYEITQGQYTEFLNQLTSAQAVARITGIPALSTNRQTIGGSWPNYTNGAPDRAMNYITWPDGLAYADWAGLRPTTELEYEKACRGPKYPITNEYAWGDRGITNQTGHDGTDGSGTETATPATAKCLYTGGVKGPVRAGIYAISNSIRSTAGSGYYGVMELSGSGFERTIVVGRPVGRSYVGTHGDGDVDSTPFSWSTSAGFELRGGSWDYSSPYARVSDREWVGGVPHAGTDARYGYRGVRTAP